MAFSALDSWITPTVAFATRISRMTRGSTNAVAKEEVSEESSSSAKTNEITADANKMSTSWSLNCSRINSHRGVAGSPGNSFVALAFTGERERYTDCTHHSFRVSQHVLPPGPKRGHN